MPYWRARESGSTRSVFLLLKCISSVAYGIVRITDLSFQLFDGDFRVSSRWISFFYGIPVSVNAHLCWAYVAERVLATVRMKTYEKQKPWFSFVLIFIMVVPSAYFVAKDTIWNEEVIISMRSVIASFAFQAFSVGCLGVLILLRIYNAHRYRISSAYPNSIPLTERYQNSENVRTTRQLTPLILLHVASMLCLGTVFISRVLQLPPETIFMHMAIINLSNGLIFIACQFAVL
ncbi:hypothetical protein AAVH_19490 [Aphelenchoides avenae]|nr:hypothetical protein AAVH_19490 [Aphelenchus avenae]